LLAGNAEPPQEDPAGRRQHRDTLRLQRRSRRGAGRHDGAQLLEQVQPFGRGRDSDQAAPEHAAGHGAVLLQDLALSALQRAQHGADPDAQRVLPDRVAAPRPTLRIRRLCRRGAAELRTLRLRRDRQYREWVRGSYQLSANEPLRRQTVVLGVFASWRCPLLKADGRELEAFPNQFATKQTRNPCPPVISPRSPL